MRRLATAALAFLVLAGCSGGGKSAAPTPTPSPTPTVSPTPPPWTLQQACAYILKIRKEGNAWGDRLWSVTKKFNAGKVSWRAPRDFAKRGEALRIRERRQLSSPPQPWPKPLAADLVIYRKGFLLNNLWEHNLGEAESRSEFVNAWNDKAMSQSNEDAYKTARESMKATCNWSD